MRPFEGYSDQGRPLGAYALLIAAFNALIGALLALAARRRGQLPDGLAAPFQDEAAVLARIRLTSESFTERQKVTFSSSRGRKCSSSSSRPCPSRC